MKMIAIGGEPATGKSTLMMSVLKSLSVSEEFRHGKVRGHRFPNEKILVIGLYAEGQGFPGTDRLSMAVQPDAIDLLDKAQELGLGNYTLLLEGDRLFTQSYLEAAKGKVERLDAILLQVGHEEVERRHVARGDSQSAQFKKSRATKYKNIAERCPFVMAWKNESEADRDALKTHILEVAGMQSPGAA